MTEAQEALIEAALSAHQALRDAEWAINCNRLWSAYETLTVAVLDYEADEAAAQERITRQREEWLRSAMTQ